MTAGGRTRDSAPRAAVPTTVLVGVGSLAVAVVMVFVVSAGGSLADPDFDPYFFGEMGKTIADGRGFEGFGSLITRRAPLYPIFIGTIYFVFGEQYRIVLLAQCLIFAGTAMLAYDLGRRHFNERAGVLAAALCSVNPLLLRYVPTLHLETVFTFLVTLMVWCTYRFWRQPTVRWGLATGLVAGLAALTKAVVLVYPAVFAVAILLGVWRARRRGVAGVLPVRSLAAIFVAMAVTIAPWTIRNYGTTGHVVLISSGTSDAFLRGFIFTEWEYVTLQEAPYVDAELRSNAYFEEVARAAGTVWERDDYETDQVLNEEAKRRLFDEPGQVARKTVTGLFTFWYQLTGKIASLIALVSALVMWALAAVGWRRARAEGTAVWPFLLPAVYLNVLLALLLALGRYSAPILPGVLVVSAFGVDTLITRWRARHA